MSNLNVTYYVRKGVELLTPLLLTSFFISPVMANPTYSDRGRVLTVTPKQEQINVPRQECRTDYERQVTPRKRSLTGSVLGGVAGGLIGSTIGKGSGRVAAAAVGAGIGAITGDRISRRNNGNIYSVRHVPVESCYQVDNWQSVTTGYHVDYQYNGRTYSTVTTDHPGKYIDINVSVVPARQAVSNYDGRSDGQYFKKHRRHLNQRRNAFYY